MGSPVSEAVVEEGEHRSLLTLVGQLCDVNVHPACAVQREIQLRQSAKVVLGQTTTRCQVPVGGAALVRFEQRGRAAWRQNKCPDIAPHVCRQIPQRVDRTRLNICSSHVNVVGIR